MKVAIVKYNAGNVRSVIFCLNRLGITPLVTDRAEELNDADRVIFPGVGEAGSAMEFLKERGLDNIIRNLQCPVLGICLGMQLMCSYSEENDTECLGIFDQPVLKFSPLKKIPHTGWNTISDRGDSLIGELKGRNYFYFVHNYYAGVSRHTTLLCQYINEFSAGLCRDNFFAYQFHPEKSGIQGERLIKNFLDLNNGENNE